jgi:hypothetical protein
VSLGTTWTPPARPKTLLAGLLALVGGVAVAMLGGGQGADTDGILAKALNDPNATQADIEKAMLQAAAAKG